MCSREHIIKRCLKNGYDVFLRGRYICHLCQSMSRTTWQILVQHFGYNSVLFVLTLECIDLLSNF